MILEKSNSKIVMKNITVGNIVKISEDAERVFNWRIFIEGNIMLNFLVEEGICTVGAQCNLRGEIETLILFVKLIEYR